MKYAVQQLSRYKLGNAPFSKNGEPVPFKTKQDAELYALKADSGIGGDMSFRYEILELAENSLKCENYDSITD